MKYRKIPSSTRNSPDLGINPSSTPADAHARPPSSEIQCPPRSVQEKTTITGELREILDLNLFERFMLRFFGDLFP